MPNIKRTYLKLGETATSFYDPVTKVKVVGDQVVMLESIKTRKISNAIRHGHLRTVSESEYNAWREGGSEASAEVESPQGSGSLDVDISKMTSKELSDFYTENYEASEDDIKAFNALDKKQKVAFLQGDEADEGEDQ